MKATILRVLAGSILAISAAGIGSGTAGADAASSLAATPASGLADGATVHLSATGLLPSASALVFQCANATADGTPLPVGATGYCSAPVPAPTDAAGRLVDFPFVVKQAGIVNPRTGNQGSCLAAGAAFPCHVLVVSGSQQLVADLLFGAAPAPTATPTPAPTPIAAAAPSTPAQKSGSGTTRAAAAQGAPTVTVNPYTGLKDGQVVKVSGSGFPAGSRLVILQCGNADANGNPLPAGTSEGHCGTPPATATADVSGNVAPFDFTVKTTFHNKPSAKDVKCIENGNYPCYIMMSEPAVNAAEDHQDIFFGNATPPTSGGSTTTTTGGSTTSGGSTSGGSTSSGGTTSAAGTGTAAGGSGSSSGGSTGAQNTARGAGSGLASTGLEASQLLLVAGAALAVGGGLVRAGRRRPADVAAG